MTITHRLPTARLCPARGTRARSQLGPAPGAFSSDIGSLPPGQIIALLILNTRDQTMLADLVRQVMPRGRSTPTAEDYLGIISRGFAEMSGGMYLTPAGTAAAGELVRMIEAG